MKKETTDKNIHKDIRKRKQSDGDEPSESVDVKIGRQV